MSGVWTEKSVPMTDHECAVEALEAVGGTILASNQNHIRLRVEGQEWSVQRSHRRYSIRYNRRASTTSIAWMNELGRPMKKLFRLNCGGFEPKRKPPISKVNGQQSKRSERPLNNKGKTSSKNGAKKFFRKPKR